MADIRLKRMTDEELAEFTDRNRRRQVAEAERMRASMQEEVHDDIERHRVEGDEARPQGIYLGSTDPLYHQDPWKRMIARGYASVTRWRPGGHIGEDPDTIAAERKRAGHPH